MPQAELSHEAAISPIAEEAVAYLMARGLGREEALAAITRGFLNLDQLDLPAPIARELDEVLAATPAGSLRQAHERPREACLPGPGNCLLRRLVRAAPSASRN